MKAAVVLLALLCCVASVAEAAQGLRFLAMGDWGGSMTYPYTTTGELAVANQMAKTAADFDSQFILAIGDNFYDDGVPNVNSPRFKYTFSNVFDAQRFPTEFYVVAGNHDHNGNVSAQIAYSKIDSRWIFPDYNYSKKFTIPDTQQTVQIVFIDTVLLCNDGDEGQFQWIDQVLAHSTADWLLVAGHYPVYSIAEHGPTSCLVQKLKPMLEQYKVAAYLCGHDHNLQHLQESGSVVDYLLTGAAHAVDYSQAHAGNVPPGSSKFFWPQNSHSRHQIPQSGFLTVEITESLLNATFIDSYGNALYNLVKANPRQFDY